MRIRPIAGDDFEWICVPNCEDTEQLRKKKYGYEYEKGIEFKRWAGY